MLVDCLIFFILKYANMKAKTPDNSGNPISKLEESQSEVLSKAAFDLLLDLVSGVSISHQVVDSSHYFDGESINASPLTLREKLVRSILHTYSSDVPQ